MRFSNKEPKPTIHIYNDESNIEDILISSTNNRRGDIEIDLNLAEAEIFQKLLSDCILTAKNSLNAEE